MATVTKGKTFISGETVEPADLHQLVDSATVTEIVNADIGASAAIAGTKIAPDFGSQNITTSGEARLGTSSQYGAGSFTDPFVTIAQGNDDTVAGLSVSAWGTSGTTRPRILLSRSNGASVGTQTAVVSGSALGSLQFFGSDGTNFIEAASITSDVDGTPGTNDMPGRLIFSTTADGGNSPTERMRITSGGTVLVGKTASGFSTEGCEMFGSGTIYATRDGDLCLTLNRLSSNGTVVSIRRSGAAVGSISVTTTATAYNTSSDYRLKENATPLIGGLVTIEQLQPCEFTWRSDGSIGRGFIAHELQAVVPEAVTGEKDAVDADGNPEYQGVDASKLVPYLVSAVQELKARVEALEAA